MSSIALLFITLESSKISNGGREPHQAANRRKRAARSQRNHRHAKACARSDTQNRRTGQRIGKRGLKHQSGSRECRTAKQRRNALWHTRLQNNHPPRLIAAIATRKNIGNCGKRYPHRTQRNVERGENDEQK